MNTVLDFSTDSRVVRRSEIPVCPPGQASRAAEAEPDSQAGATGAIAEVRTAFVADPGIESLVGRIQAGGAVQSSHGSHLIAVIERQLRKRGAY